MRLAFNRRALIGGAGGMLSTLALPRFALAMPPVSEITHDPAIPALANPQGDVTIVEVVDYQCPYCKLCYLEIMKLVAEDPGVRLVMKDWPVFGPGSEFAARALLSSASDPAYAAAVDGLMRNERKLTERRAKAVLEEAGLDIAALPALMESRKTVVDGILARNASHAAEFELKGTPALLVGNVLYRHGLPLSSLREAILKARAAGDPSAS